MEYIKTYEQVQDFYGGKKKYIIVTTDEKYIVNRWGGRVGAKHPYLHPIEKMEEDMDIFLFSHDVTDTLKSLNNDIYNYDFGNANTGDSDKEFHKQILETGKIFDINMDPYDEENSFKIIEFQAGIQKNSPLNI